MPKMTGEDLVSIRDDGIRKTMYLDNCIPKTFNHLFTGVIISECSKVCMFRRFINDYYD